MPDQSQSQLQPKPLQTPLHARHVAVETIMADECGWTMPPSYRGALDLLERLCTADVLCQEDNTARLQAFADHFGGKADDRPRKSSLLSVAGPMAPKPLDAPGTMKKLDHLGSFQPASLSLAARWAWFGPVNRCN